MKKRIFYIMLITLVITTLMGCNSNSNDMEQQTVAKTPTITTTPEVNSNTPQTDSESTPESDTDSIPESESISISEEDALNIIAQYVQETVEDAESIQLGYSYEDIQALTEVNDTCHVYRVGSEAIDTSTTIGFYAVSLDGTRLYVMDPLSGTYVSSEDIEIPSNNEEQANDSTTTDHVLAVLGFQLLDEVMEFDGVHISFPQFTNENDPTTADLINDSIQEDLKSYLATYELPTGEVTASTLELTYELKGIESKVLSIIYKGLLISKDAVYPINEYHTLNILVGEDVHSVPLSEAFIIDNILLDMIKDGMYSPYTQDLNLEESIDNFRELIESNWADSDLYDYLNANPNYYFTEYGVIVSIEIPHVLGDHLEMAIPYEAIEINMNKDNAIWQDYMFINQG